MQVAPPQGGQQGAPQQGSGGSPSPEQAIQMIQSGFKAIAGMLQQAGAQLPPEDIKLFQAAMQATDNFIQAISSPPQGGQPQSPQGQASGRAQPMPANANPRAVQAGPQGR